MTPALTALRARTTPAHRRLDSGLRYLLDERLSATAYARVLTAMLGFHAPLEARLVPHAEALLGRGIDVGARRKSAWLLADLRSLGQAEVTTVPTRETPEVPSVAEALGCLYVTEGATLGGRVISAALARSLQLGPVGGAVFFGGYGDHTAARWREVIAALGGLDEAEVEPAVAAGAALFAAMERWLELQGCLS